VIVDDVSYGRRASYVHGGAKKVRRLYQRGSIASNAGADIIMSVRLSVTLWYCIKTNTITSLLLHQWRIRRL